MKTLYLEPAGGRDDVAAVVFFHGWGDTALGWRDTLALLQQRHCRHIRFVLPTAPVGKLGHTRWLGLPMESAGEHDEILAHSLATVQELVQEQINRGVPSHRILLAGFSQGAALAVYAAFHLGVSLAGVAMLSGYVPYHDRFQMLDHPAAIPVRMFHGDEDPVIAPKIVGKGFNLLQSCSVSVSLKNYPKLQHEASTEELGDVTRFFMQRCPPSRPIISVEMVSDILCPWCWAGKRQLQVAMDRNRDKYDFDVTLHPYLVRPSIPEAGVAIPATKRTVPRSVIKLGERLGLKYTDCCTRVPNTVAAHCLIQLSAAMNKDANQVAEALFEAYFRDGQDVGDLDVLVEVGEVHGIPDRLIRHYCTDEQFRKRVLQQASHWSSQGLPGVPLFKFNGRVAFSGAQEPEAFEYFWRKFGDEDFRKEWGIKARSSL